MKVKFNITQSFLGIMILILVLVSAVGFFTYEQFIKVLDNAKESNKPDPIISTTKTLISTVTKAENKVKTYSLTEDTLFIVQYEAYRKDINSQLSRLETDMRHTEIKSVPLDTLKSLVHQKLMIYDSLLILQNEFRVHQALEKVTASIDDAAEIIPALIEEEEKERRFLFFKRKKRKKKKDALPDTLVPPEIRVDYDEVKNNLELISAYETYLEEQQLRTEFALLEQDKAYNTEIQKIVAQLENEGLKLDRQRAAETETIVQSANVQILIFCLLISALLILTSYTIIRYITRSTRYRKILKEAKNEAESLAQAKEHFVATVSHEIRTPMNIISGFSEQLSNTELNEHQQDQLQTVIKASSHLLKLINEVLDFTKLQNYKLQLEANDFVVHHVLQEVHDLMTPLAEAKAINLEFHVEPNVPNVLVGDAIRLSQILINVSSNAIKFTHDGHVTIHVENISNEASNAQLKFIIRDSGIGMSQDKINRVFEAFEQAEASTSRTYGGTGLGLSITKKLIELHNGKVAVSSEEGVGTEITIEIPYALGQLENIETKSTLGKESVDLSSVHILVADDEPYNRKLLVTILNKYKARFAEVTNGREAVDLTERSEFDLILMDARMPVLNGLEAAQQIRKGSLNKRTPIVGLSAAVTEEDQKSYFNAGMNYFLPKPFKESDFLNILLKALDRNDAQIMTESISEHSELLDFSSLRSLSGEDDTFYIEMLETFISGTQEGFVELSKFVDQSEMLKVSDIAHKISSPCKHLDAHDLYSILKSIENVARDTPENKKEILELIEKGHKEATEVVQIVAKELAKYKEN